MLLIDVMNDLECDGGEVLLAHALPMVERLAELKRRATQLGMPTLSVNENFGRWQSDSAMLLAHCLASQDPEENRHAPFHMRRVLKADIRPSTGLDLQALMRRRPAVRRQDSA